MRSLKNLLCVAMMVALSGCALFNGNESDGSIPDDSLVKTEEQKADFEEACKTNLAVKPTTFFFGEETKTAYDEVKKYCQGSQDVEVLLSASKASLTTMTGKAAAIGIETDMSLSEFTEGMRAKIDGSGRIPSLSYRPSSRAMDTNTGVEHGTSLSALVTDQDKCNQSVMALKGQNGLTGPDANFTCNRYFSDMASVYGTTQNMFEDKEVYALSRQLTYLDKEWTDFLEVTRAQTLLEVALNSYLYREKTGDWNRFTRPPASQVVLLHPSIAVDWTEGANDGDEFTESFVIDVIGMNWWKGDLLGFTGAAGHLAYSDRADIKDWGWGLTLYYKNKYSVGFTERGGEVGVFITMDLLKQVNDKINIAKKYRGLDFLENFK